MTVFLDTSVLLKLYISEEESDTIRSIVNSYAEVAVSSLSYVELHSAVSRRRREGSIRVNEMTNLFKDFEKDWFEFIKIRLDDSILKRAGKLCLNHPIRALDAIQLATALVTSENQDEPLLFLTADKRLETAALAEKLLTHS